MTTNVEENPDKFSYVEDSSLGLKTQALRNAARALDDVIEVCVPDSREKYQAKIKVEEAIMWANKGLYHRS